MGYTGLIQYNGGSVFQEWKSSNYQYCMEYATTYMRSKPCLLDIKSINSAYKTIHRGVTGYGAIASRIESVLKIIRSLTHLIDNDFDDIFDENGNLIAVVKMQNSDCSGNSQDINFYEKNRVSDVADVEFHQRMTITEEEMRDIKTKRYTSIKCIDIFSSFDELENGRNRYHSMVDDIMNIKSISDVYTLIETMQSVYLEVNRLYLKSYKTAMAVTKLLEEIKVKILDGTPFYVRYAENHLYLINGNTFENTDIEVDDFFMFRDLFQNNGIDGFGAGVKITNKKILSEFISSFPMNEYRSGDFEKAILHIYNHIGDEDTFSLQISGGY